MTKIEPTYEELKAELDKLNMAAIAEANKPKVLTADELKNNRLKDYNKYIQSKVYE